MNTNFLERYTKLQLDDLEEYTDENHIRFQAECSSFLSTIKEMDLDLYRDVMTMSPCKQNNLMQTIYNMNEGKILDIPLAESLNSKLEELSKFEPELAEILKSEALGSNSSSPPTDAELADFRESLINAGISSEVIEEISLRGIASGSVKWFSKTIRKIKPWNANTNPDALPPWTKLFLWLLSLSSVLLLALITMSTVVTLIILAVLILSILAIVNEVEVLSSAKETILLTLHSIALFVKNKSNIKFSKRFEAIHALETTQLVACLGACKVTPETTSTHARHRIIRLYALRDRSIDPKRIPIHMQIAADCILICSLKYMTSMVAELYGALKSCVENTSGGSIKLSIDNVVDISRIDLPSTCEPIRDELIKLTNQFRDFLEVAYKHDSATRNKWLKVLDTQIKKVVNGQHSRPVAIAPMPSYQSPAIVFEI